MPESPDCALLRSQALLRDKIDLGLMGTDERAEEAEASPMQTPSTRRSNGSAASQAKPAILSRPCAACSTAQWRFILPVT
jgi:hypothetical protein